MRIDDIGCLGVTGCELDGLAGPDLGVLHPRRRRRVETDLAGNRGRRQPVRSHHRLAERGVLDATLGAERADDRRPCGDADRHAQVDA